MRATLRTLRMTLVALLAGVAPARSQEPAQFQELNILVGRGQHVEATLKVLEYRANSPGLLYWLEAMANAGIVPLAYELSRRSTDLNSVIRWYAVGYVGQSLATSECADSAQNPNAILLSATYSPMGKLTKGNDALFIPALERALAMEYMGTFRVSDQ